MSEDAVRSGFSAKWGPVDGSRPAQNPGIRSISIKNPRFPLNSTRRMARVPLMLAEASFLRTTFSRIGIHRFCFVERKRPGKGSFPWRSLPCFDKSILVFLP